MRIFAETFIKIIAFLSALLVFFIILALFIGFFTNTEKHTNFAFKEGDKNSLNKIAIIELNGPILNEPSGYVDIKLLNNIEFIYVNRVEKILEELKKEKVKGLIISINSPGGSVSASYKLYNLLKKFKKNNNIKIFFHSKELLASGAYWAALSGDKIFANYGSLIGSIGVKGPDWIYFDEPLAISSGIFGMSIQTKKGIKKFNNIAGSSKDIFDPFRPPTKEEINELQSYVQNIYQDFVNIVSKNRSIENDVIINDIKAMIYDTKTAKKKFLIDDVVTLKKVMNIMSVNLKLDNYQIIEMKNYKSSFIQKLIETNFFSSIYFDNIQKSQIKYMCKITKFGLSSIIIYDKSLRDC